MARDTKIIEFFGLPACGKSTLCANLEEKLEEKEKKVATLHQIEQIIRKENLWVKIKSIPYKTIPLYLLLFISLPITNFKYKSFYILSLKISWIYRYACNFTSFNYVLIEHGIIQNLNSIMFQKPPILSTFSLSVLREILFLENVKCMVYCNISPSLAIERIHRRGTPNHGRLDGVSDISRLFKCLNNQKILFEIIEEYIKERQLCITLNMKDDPKIICHNVYEKIRFY